MSFSHQSGHINKTAIKAKLTIEAMEPLVLLSASPFDLEQVEHHEAEIHGGCHSSSDDVDGDDADPISDVSGEDLLRGDSGNDVLRANEGSSVIKGGAGNDTIIGGSGGATLKGEAGDDTIIDGGGSDLIDGGFGQDLFVVDRPLSDYTIRDLANNDFEIQSDVGTDVVTAVERIRFADGEYVVSELLQQINTANGIVIPPVPANPITPDSVAGQVIHGTNSNDQINATVGDDLVTSGQGDDNVQGDLGDDILNGGEGNDVLNGGEGDDRLMGGAGDDTLIVGNGNDFVDGGEGNDTAVFNTVFDVVDIGNDIVRVQSIEGTDTITNVERTIDRRHTGFIRYSVNLPWFTNHYGQFTSAAS